jgi:hypothetical protein
LLSELRVAVVRSEKVVAEAGAVRESRERWTSVVESRYEATASVDWEYFMCALVTVIFVVCKAVRLS